MLQSNKQRFYDQSKAIQGPLHVDLHRFISPTAAELCNAIFSQAVGKVVGVQRTWNKRDFQSQMILVAVKSQVPNNAGCIDHI